MNSSKELIYKVIATLVIVGAISGYLIWMNTIRGGSRYIHVPGTSNKEAILYFVPMCLLLFLKIVWKRREE